MVNLSLFGVREVSSGGRRENDFQNLHRVVENKTGKYGLVINHL